MSVPGVPGLHKVSDDLYRSGQPTAQGMRKLQKMGIGTVVNLRLSAFDRHDARKAGLDYVHIPMRSWHVRDEDMVRFLEVATNRRRTPSWSTVGTVRTGVAVAVYRVTVCGWSKEEAIREMTQGGCGFHSLWSGLEAYVRTLDVAALKERGGIR